MPDHQQPGQQAAPQQAPAQAPGLQGPAQAPGGGGAGPDVRAMDYASGQRAVSPDGVGVGDALLNEPTLAKVSKGQAWVSRGAGPHVRAIQNALLAAGKVLPKYGADGSWGGETAAAVRDFQDDPQWSLSPDGVVGKNTLLALVEATGGRKRPAAAAPTPAPVATPAPAATPAGPAVAPAPNPSPAPQAAAAVGGGLTNPFFEGNATLKQVAAGATVVKAGKGRHITLLQQALINIGYNLPVYGADGGWGGETVIALRQFQSDHTGAVTGVLDAATMAALDQQAPSNGQPIDRSPNYDELFKDGLLDATIAVGYDEQGTFDWEIEQIRDRIQGDLGLSQVDEAAAAKAYKGAGMDMPSHGGGEFFLKQGALEHKGKKVSVLVRLITYRDPEARAAYLESMQKSDATVYTGHGRYGSGPDFDDKHSSAGNVWINPDQAIHEGGANGIYQELRRDGAEHPLDNIDFDRKYKVWFFDGCNTRLYDRAIRANAKLDHRSVDVFGAGTEIASSTTDDDVISFVGALMKQKSAGQIVGDLNRVNGITDKSHGFQADGMGDNPIAAH